MKTDFYTVTTVNIETKLLARLKTIAQKEFDNGTAPNKSVSRLVNELLKQSVQKRGRK